MPSSSTGLRWSFSPASVTQRSRSAPLAISRVAPVATQRKQLAGGVIRAGYEMRSEGIRITDAKLAIRAA
jgi:hypothetical protein